MLRSIILNEKLYQKTPKEILQIQTIEMFIEIQKKSHTAYKSLESKKEM